MALTTWASIPLGEAEGGGFEMKGPSQLPEDHPEVDVPHDGMCLWHTHIAARDAPSWVKTHKENGYGSSREQVQGYLERAKSKKPFFRVV